MPFAHVHNAFCPQYPLVHNAFSPQCTIPLSWILGPQVFVAVEETAETSLRILDSGKPNLKDAAFAFKRIEEELNEPLIGRLAQIPDYGEIDLCLNLKSEHLGSLSSYLKAMLKKREADWLSVPVLAAACVNPVYMYASEEADRWAFAKSTACEQAVGEVIQKLLWGNSKAQADALDGLDRYLHGEGIYSAEGGLELLMIKVNDPVSFFRHVGRSSLLCDQIFAKEIAIPLVCAFANQSASERLNKYMADSTGDKKRSGQDLNKARKVCRQSRQSSTVIKYCIQ